MIYSEFQNTIYITYANTSGMFVDSMYKNSPRNRPLKFDTINENEKANIIWLNHLGVVSGKDIIYISNYFKIMNPSSMPVSAEVSQKTDIIMLFKLQTPILS